MKTPTYRFVVFWKQTEEGRTHQEWITGTDVLSALERFHETHKEVYQVTAIRRDGFSGWN
jgi:hypothetical protein